MKDIHFRVWHTGEQKMYYRGYQKWLHVLLCEDDRGQNEGKGRPVKRSSYQHCIFLEGTGLRDKRQREIFEGDIVRVRAGGLEFRDTVGPIPDMFGTRKIHPLSDLFRKHGVQARLDEVDIEILGNEYETPALLGK